MPNMSAILPGTSPARNPKLLDQVRDVLRRKHFSLRTEQAYVGWIRRFILFHAKRHPPEMAEQEVTEFLTHLAREGQVAASTQNQALSALLFLYKEVLKAEIGWLDGVERVKRPARLPVVLARDEVHKIFAHLHGTPRLMAGLLYGSGLRLMECVRLRVKAGSRGQKPAGLSQTQDVTAHISRRQAERPPYNLLVIACSTMRAASSWVASSSAALAILRRWVS